MADEAQPAIVPVGFARSMVESKAPDYSQMQPAAAGLTPAPVKKLEADVSAEAHQAAAWAHERIDALHKLLTAIFASDPDADAPMISREEAQELLAKAQGLPVASATGASAATETAAATAAEPAAPTGATATASA